MAETSVRKWKTWFGGQTPDQSPRVRYLGLSDTAELVLTRVSIVNEWKLDVRLKLSVADVVKEFTLDTDTQDWEAAQPIAELVGKAWLDELATATSTALATLG